MALYIERELVDGRIRIGYWVSGMVGDQGSATVDGRIRIGFLVSGMVGDQGSATVGYIICICCNVYIKLGCWVPTAAAPDGLEGTFSTVELEVLGSIPALL